MKCLICEKKLHKLMKDLHTCRCQGIYCRQHILDHSCSFDYKKMERENLSKTLPIVIPVKVEK